MNLEEECVEFSLVSFASHPSFHAFLLCSQGVSVWHSVAVCCSLLQSVAVCCSLLQSVAVCGCGARCDAPQRDTSNVLHTHMFYVPLLFTCWSLEESDSGVRHLLRVPIRWPALTIVLSHTK